MHSDGKTIHLQTGDFQAKIVAVDAGLAELTHRGRHIVISYKPEEMPLTHLEKVLVPWPDRVAGGCYQHNGETFQLAINDPVSYTAIHGLLAWRGRQINQLSNTGVSLTIFLLPSYGYPLALVSEMIYRLEADSGLHAIIWTQNMGDEIVPYGTGAHPYLTCNQHPIDDCELTLLASEETCDERGFAAQRHIA